MSNSVYSVVELIGSSPDSWEKATANAIEEAARSIGTDLRVAEVVEMDVLIEEGRVLAYRSKVRLSYKAAGVS
jgi:flavin-binding protein dodecin